MWNVNRIEKVLDIERETYAPKRLGTFEKKI